jgi:hypothetical protein
MTSDSLGDEPGVITKLSPRPVAAPLSALDLPLKVLIWSDEGQVKVSYYAPEELGRRHGLPQDLVEKLAGIGPLTDALTAD